MSMHNGAGAYNSSTELPRAYTWYTYCGAACCRGLGVALCKRVAMMLTKCLVSALVWLIWVCKRCKYAWPGAVCGTVLMASMSTVVASFLPWEDVGSGVFTVKISWLPKG